MVCKNPPCDDHTAPVVTDHCPLTNQSNHCVQGRILMRLFTKSIVGKILHEPYKTISNNGSSPNDIAQYLQLIYDHAEDECNKNEKCKENRHGESEPEEEAGGEEEESETNAEAIKTFLELFLKVDDGFDKLADK